MGWWPVRTTPASPSHTFTRPPTKRLLALNPVRFYTCSCTHTPPPQPINTPAGLGCIRTGRTPWYEGPGGEALVLGLAPDFARIRSRSAIMASEMSARQARGKAGRAGAVGARACIKLVGWVARQRRAATSLTFALLGQRPRQIPSLGDAAAAREGGWAPAVHRPGGAGWAGGAAVSGSLRSSKGAAALPRHDSARAQIRPAPADVRCRGGAASS